MEIDGVIYVGVTGTQEVMGVQGQTILSHVKKQGIQVIQGKQKNGFTVQLVPEGFIQSLVVSHECEIGEKVEINGVVYVGVVNREEVMGVKGSTIVNNAKKQHISMLSGKQKNEYPIQLIPKGFIQSLVVSYMCEA